MSPEKVMTRLEMIELLFSMATQLEQVRDTLTSQISLGTKEEWEAHGFIDSAFHGVWSAAAWLNTDLEKKAGTQ